MPVTVSRQLPTRNPDELQQDSHPAWSPERAIAFAGYRNEESSSDRVDPHGPRAAFGATKTRCFQRV